MSDLDSLEKKIDLTVLKWYNREDYRAKQERFRQTVMAAHAIVSQKLYKTKSQTVESYFRDVWKISRASVYRFLDCALVLEQLKDFPDWSKPSHERLCRSLKKLTKNPDHRRYLWKTVLLKAGENPNLITSTFIKKVWQELIASGKIPNIKDNDNNNVYKKKKNSGQDSKVLFPSTSLSTINLKKVKEESIIVQDQNNYSTSSNYNNCDNSNSIIDSSSYNTSTSSSSSSITTTTNINYDNDNRYLKPESSMSSLIYRSESITHSPSMYESSIQQNINSSTAIYSNDTNWFQDSSQSILNTNINNINNKNEQSQENNIINNKSDNYNKYRILSPPLSNASSYSNLPYNKSINYHEKESFSPTNCINENINSSSSSIDNYSSNNNDYDDNINNSNSNINKRDNFFIDQSVYSLSLNDTYNDKQSNNISNCNNYSINNNSNNNMSININNMNITNNEENISNYTISQNEFQNNVNCNNANFNNMDNNNNNNNNKNKINCYNNVNNVINNNKYNLNYVNDSINNKSNYNNTFNNYDVSNNNNELNQQINCINDKKDNNQNSIKHFNSKTCKIESTLSNICDFNQNVFKRKIIYLNGQEKFNKPAWSISMEIFKNNNTKEESNQLKNTSDDNTQSNNQNTNNKSHSSVLNIENLI